MTMVSGIRVDANFQFYRRDVAASYVRLRLFVLFPHISSPEKNSSSLPPPARLPPDQSTASEEGDWGSDFVSFGGSI